MRYITLPRWASIGNWKTYNYQVLRRQMSKWRRAHLSDPMAANHKRKHDFEGQEMVPMELKIWVVNGEENEIMGAAVRRFCGQGIDIGKSIKSDAMVHCTQLTEVFYLSQHTMRHVGNIPVDLFSLCKPGRVQQSYSMEEIWGSHGPWWVPSQDDITGPPQQATTFTNWGRQQYNGEMTCWQLHSFNFYYMSPPIATSDESWSL